MKSKIIVITGSIATGKSSVSNYLKDKGYLVIDADKIAHDLMQRDEINYKNIVSHFGDSILDEQMNIDRRKLGDIVFSDKTKLQELNNLTHNNIFNKINDIIKNNKSEIIFVDIPLFIELKVEGEKTIDTDEVWLVYAERKLQLERLMSRNKMGIRAAGKRIRSQMNIEDKVHYADFIIDNSHSLEYTFNQVEEKLRTL